MKKLNLYLSIICLLLIGNACAQSEATKADNLLSESIDNNEHALSVLVAKGDKVLYHKTIGYADAENKKLADNNSTFRIGSVTKQFYATAILKLVEQGKINLDDPLSKYIEDFPRGNEVTIHHLLTHTSGIKSYTDQPDFIGGVTKPIKLQDLIAKIKTLGYDFDPGEKWKYNNSAYLINGYIVEKVSGMPADKFLEQNIFTPVDMDNTGTYENSKKYKNEALGYANEGGTIKPALDWDMTWAGGAGNLYSTAYDLFLWNQQLFGGKVLSKESMEKAHAKVKLGDGTYHPYGYGWGLSEYKELNMIAHSGGLHGFLTNLAYYPEIDGTIVVLSNCSPPKKVVPGNISEKLTDIFFAEHLTENVAVAINFSEYDKYVGQYEYPGGAIMTVSKEGNKLMAQLTGQAKFEIFPKGDHVFFWKAVNAEITFNVNENGEVDYGKHKQNGFEAKVPRVVESKEVALEKGVFENYAGEYNLNGATMKVWKEGEAFYTQLTGQQKFQIYPKSNTRFFLKEIAAELEFDNSQSPAPSFILYQAGREIKAVRK